MKKSSKIISKLYKIHIKFETHCATQWAAVKIWMLSINEPIKQIIGLATEISYSKIFGIRIKKICVPPQNCLPLFKRATTHGHSFN